MADEHVHVNLEKVDQNAIISTTGYWWPDVAKENVSAVFDKTWLWGKWKHFKLAYGVQQGRFGKIENLKWFTVQQAEDTMLKLFEDINLKPGYDYFLLISNLPETQFAFQKIEPDEDKLIYYNECVKKYGTIESQMHPISYSLAKLTQYT
jgi:hypothetical protein